jgi:flagellar motor switch protein FliG
VDRGTEKFIMEELGKSEPNLAEEIRKRMFIFEDIVTLDEISIQRFLREVDTKDLLIALKGASKDVSDVFYANMSSRMAEMMREEGQYMRSVRLVEVEEAQQKLVGIVRKLEDLGEIYISRSRKDEIVV